MLKGRKASLLSVETDFLVRPWPDCSVARGHQRRRRLFHPELQVAHRPDLRALVSDKLEG